MGFKKVNLQKSLAWQLSERSRINLCLWRLYDFGAVLRQAVNMIFNNAVVDHEPAVFWRNWVNNVTGNSLTRAWFDPT